MSLRHSPAVGAAFAAVPALVLGACTPDRVPPPRAEECEVAEFRPTYLPWLEPGDEVPAGTELLSTKSIRWSPGMSRDTRFVALQTRRNSALDEYRDAGFERLTVRGEEAYLVWVGDPGVGEVTIHWDEGESPCSSYALHYLEQGSSQRRIEAEITKIAESLR